ncbi:MAG: AAA family ATPase, partial [Nitrososphaera sp.]|nr:AAA family ATPase [Nitrososphaera sp.]
NKGSCTLVPGEGKHFFFYKKRFVYLWNVVEPMQIGGVNVGYRRSTVLQIIPGSRKVGEEFIREAETYFNSCNNQMVTVHTSDMWGNNWRASNLTYKRPLQSVILPAATKKDLYNDIAEFKESKNRYRNLNIPWRRGYLLYGKPGNGKTSLALAIASEFNYPMYTLQLASIHEDEKLRVLCDSLPENAVLLIEDIDCTAASEDRVEKTDGTTVRRRPCVSLSGLLNALDGVTSSEGRIVIMTTNHPDRLDPALVRPGRADKHVEISMPTPEQAEELFERFYGKSPFAKQFAASLDYEAISMATLQVFFLTHKTAEEAVRNRFQLLPKAERALAEAWSE